MNTRIREAVDKLMQPENIQNTVNQEQIIEETAESVVRDAGARIQEQPMQQEQEPEAEYEDGWNQEGLSDRELFERIGEEMRMEAQAAGEWTMEM